ncbi:MAG TPA: rhomboid family intramembrane serine protease [Solirubrobacteraceae bacterium]
MTSGADLFVVCKQCESEVSPYITECPYCGSRLRRRAPKLPRMHGSTHAPSSGGRLRSLLGRGKPAPARRRRRARVAPVRSRWAADRPYATMLLVALGCVGWIVWHAEPDLYEHAAVIGPLNGEWWRLFTNEFAYADGVVAFVVLLAVAIFGWLLERRHGPATVLALFFGASAAGALVALAVYPFPVLSGGTGAALALLAAWAAPDLEAARAGEHYEGDLLGVAAIAALLLAIPFARPEVSWLAGVTGGALGLVVGLGMHRLVGTES